ncbi:MAG: shikimate kinase [Planctomycetes bacterium]|nr:shikimate kinase [Planctomycetota bacterium]
MNVVLIGYRGSGKTTVGRILAERNDVGFVDTDELIVHQAGQGIAQIFASEGEDGFRTREEAAIAMAVRIKERVISVGGGAVELPSNRSLLRAYGSVIWLQADADSLSERISKDDTSATQRPNLGQGGLEEVRDVLKRRNPLYAKLAHLAISTAGKSPTTIAEDIEAWLNL